MHEIPITTGASLPDLTVTWRDRDGAVIPFATEPYTFRLCIGIPGQPAIIDKTTGISGADTTPNVTVAFAANELDPLVPSWTYEAQLWATRVSDGKKREPYRFAIPVRRAMW